MVDVELLRRTISKSGITITHLAKEAGISRETLYNRLENPEFKVSEVQRIGKALHLSNEQLIEIFLANKVN